jgi:hypothetical protein
MKLAINWETFSQQIDKYETEANAICEKEITIKTEPEFEAIKADIKDWSIKGHEFLKKSFDEESNEFAETFHSARENRINIGNQKKDFDRIKKETFEDFKAKRQTLVYFKRILSISDIIIKPEIITLTIRSAFTTEETLELILEKLYDVYDDHYYSISMILAGNGIVQKKHGEDRELIKLLENNGYVNVMHLRDASAQLTISGKLFVEEKRKVYKENYDDINKSSAEINERVDAIIEKLTNLGYGQEIIFEEIQELKELYTTLNKKNWGQIVKGKIVDLALAKLIENETLEYIYKTLTDHKLRLP